MEETKISNKNLAELAALAKMQIELEEEIEQLQNLVKEKIGQLDRIRQFLIPELMREIGIDRIDLTTGEKIVVRSFVGGSIKEENRAAAFDWLRRNGFGSLIKNEITAKFSMGEEDRAESLFEDLVKSGYVVDRREAVHPQTLNAFVREQLSNGRWIPSDLFGIFERRESVVSRKR